MMVFAQDAFLFGLDHRGSMHDSLRGIAFVHCLQTSLGLKNDLLLLLRPCRICDNLSWLVYKLMHQLKRELTAAGRKGHDRSCST